VAAFRGEPHVLLAGEDGRCERLDPAGETVETLPLRSGAGDRLRLFRGPVREPIALTFSIWSSDLRAFDADGGELWRHPRKDGIDDVWPVDLDGDGIDEVVVGHNGGSGLCVLGHDGEHLWSRTDVGNVWHVCGGALGSAEQGLVVSTSAAGDVHLFTRDSRVDIDVPFYASMVRVVDEGEPDGPLVLVAGRSGDAGIELAALAPDGTPRWSDALPVLEDAFVDSAAVAPAKGWCAVGLRGGLVHVVDVPTGALLATLEDQGGRPEVAWLHRAGAQDPLLVVATGEAANAFRIVARE
jgi:outer membrane protein assembly factor BamB